MAKKHRHWFIIREEAIWKMGVGSALDMLRYDAATVECNPPRGFYLFSNEHGPCIDRWKSFGVKVDGAKKAEYPPHFDL